MNFNKPINILLDLILPPTCIGCSKIISDHHQLCHECWSGLKFNIKPFCYKCSLPFSFTMDEHILCTNCLSAKDFHLEQLRFPFIYNEAISQLIMTFKHCDNLRSAKLFSKWLINSAPSMLQETDLITSVPLHTLRLLKRKYNQAALLANNISKITKKPVNNQLLIRKKNVIQGIKTKLQRKNNVKGLFIINSKMLDLVMGKNITIIDDVYTTGATINQCAKILYEAGAQKVNGLTLARVCRRG